MSITVIAGRLRRFLWITILKNINCMINWWSYTYCSGKGDLMWTRANKSKSNSDHIKQYSILKLSHISLKILVVDNHILIPSLPAVHLMVASYTWGMDADRFDGLTTDDIISQCLEDIAVIHDRDLVLIPTTSFSGYLSRKLDCFTN